MQLDEHTDWVNQLIYLPTSEAVLSCSNDTTIKLWMLPQFSGNNTSTMLSDRENSEHSASSQRQSLNSSSQSPLRVNSYYTIDNHADYVRAMAFSRDPGRIFSISDDGQLMIHDLAEQALVAEYSTQKAKQPMFGSSYVPINKASSPNR